MELSNLFYFVFSRFWTRYGQLRTSWFRFGKIEEEFIYPDPVKNLGQPVTWLTRDKTQVRYPLTFFEFF
jgi:hypothetical protein